MPSSPGLITTTTAATTTTSTSTTTTTTTMSTLPPCPVPSAVKNAQPPTLLGGGNVAEYSCAFGFKMSGTSRVYCDRRTLQWMGKPPSCTLITHPTHYPVWAYGLIAGLLGLIAFTFIACLLAYCCGWCPNSVAPLGGSASGSWPCCRKSRRRRRRSFSSQDDDRMTDVEQDGAFYVPVTRQYTNNSRHVQKTVRHIVVSEPNKGHPNMVVDGYYTSNAYMMPGKTQPSQQPKWMPHSHPVRNNNDSTR
ncbi:uncharacterized protein [Haliotis asinina]|uniref:uncharacterized protein n=1 Tax=Haliotis asinina TaxID=109174 RepID=UPI003532228E